MAEESHTEAEPVSFAWITDGEVDSAGHAILRRFALAHERRQVARLVFAVLFVLAFLGASGFVSWVISSALLGAAFGALILLALLRSAEKRLERRYADERRDDGFGRTEATLSKDGLRLISGATHTEVGWSEFRAVFPFDGFLILLATYGGGAYLPMNATTADPSELRGVVPAEIWQDRPEKLPLISWPWTAA